MKDRDEEVWLEIDKEVRRRVIVVLRVARSPRPRVSASPHPLITALPCGRVPESPRPRIDPSSFIL